MTYFWVFIGGGLGSISRFALAQYLNRPFQFPWGTFVANTLSCIVLGILIALVSKAFLADEHKLLLMVGFCGGFSTFSTFSSELLLFIREGNWLMAMAYFSASMLAGLLALYAGMKVAS